jgi:hypothetical protein
MLEALNLDSWPSWPASRSSLGLVVPGRVDGLEPDPTTGAWAFARPDIPSLGRLG